MAINLADERRIGLKEAASLYPSFREGKPTHLATVWRHVTRGVRLANGDTIRLEAYRLGGRWTTSAEAIERFMSRLTAGALGDEPDSEAVAVPTTRQRQRQLERVDRELEKAGI
jgi:Protein of unknown function (DUF1580)